MSVLWAILGEVDEDTSVMASEELRRHLGASIAVLGREHASAFVAPPVVTGGLAEFGGILRTCAPSYRIARSIAETCHPFPVRIALAAGRIESGLDTHDVERMEGEALDTASELLYRARKEGRFLSMRTGDPALDPILNALLSLHQRRMEAWTDRQREVVDLYRKLGTQGAVARKLGVSQQSISHTLSGAEYRHVREVEVALQAALDRLDARGPVVGGGGSAPQ